MKIVATADIHGNLPEIPDCDLLLIAGDITLFDFGTESLQTRWKWFDKSFRNWLESVPAKHIVGIAGNHDWSFVHNTYPKDLPWHYLEDSAIVIDGLKVYGTPWQPPFFDWAFNLEEDQLDEKFKLIPEDTDILVAHGPPAGYGDTTRRGEHVGSTSLYRAIDRVNPKLCVFGHIHEAYGTWHLDNITLANVSLVDHKYRPTHDPVIFNI